MTPRETRFVKSLVDSGLVSLNEAVQLEGVQRQLKSSTGEYKPIWELAIEHNLITATQSERVMTRVVATAESGVTQTREPAKEDTRTLAPADSGPVPTGGGRRLGKYELISKIGQGGMGAVYKARQESMNRVVALKVLPRSLAGNKEFIARFLREARAAGRLSHPNIVAGIDAGFAEGYYYFAMEFVEGESLGERLVRDGVVPETEAALFCAQVAKALDHAHAMGIVHRDVKPENILVTPRSEIKLCDMGLARTGNEDMRVTQAGMAVGTPFYISPEQVRGKTPTAQSDIYSLGCTLFHLVTGRPPYDGENAMQVMQQHLNAEIPRAGDVREGISRAVEVVILKMMARDPEDRYETAREAADDLESAAGGGIPSALTEAVAERRRAGRRGPGTTRSARSARSSTRNEKPISTRDMPVPAAEREIRPLERRARRRAAQPQGAPLKLIITFGGLLILLAAVILIVVSIHAREDDREVLEGRTHGDGLLPPPPPRPEHPKPPPVAPEPEVPERVVVPPPPPGRGREVKVVLQDGLRVAGGTYAGTRDTYVATTSREGKANYGGRTSMLCLTAPHIDRRMLIRFTVFAANGGPIPDRAEIVSARLRLYKQNHYPAGLSAHDLLRAWAESQANGFETGTGEKWGQTGAAAGRDFSKEPAGTYAVTGGKIGWADIDVTSSLRAWSAGKRPNHGWLLTDESVDKINFRMYSSREEREDPSRRPKLEIIYIARD